MSSDIFKWYLIPKHHMKVICPLFWQEIFFESPNSKYVTKNYHINEWTHSLYSWKSTTPFSNRRWLCLKNGCFLLMIINLLNMWNLKKYFLFYPDIILYLYNSIYFCLNMREEYLKKKLIERWCHCFQYIVVNDLFLQAKVVWWLNFTSVNWQKIQIKNRASFF